MQTQYRPYPPQRSPHTAAPARRGPGPMIAPTPQTGANPPSLIHINRAEKPPGTDRHDTSRHISLKPTDRTIPDGVEDCIVGDGVAQYRELRELERKLDAVMTRKRMDVQDNVGRDVKRYKTLRIWISNTVENQPWQAKGLDENAFDFSTGIEATYKVKIEGRLLDDDDDEDDNRSDTDDDDNDDKKDANKPDGDAMDHDGGQPANPPATPKPRKRLSHFFKSITIDFDRSRSLQPDGTTQIEWKRPAVAPHTVHPPAAADFDVLEFERKGDENINITVNLVRDETPERFRLSPELAAVLDTDEEDRTEVMMGIWNYVQTMGLQEEEDKRGVQCDEPLKAAFGQDTLHFPQLRTLLKQRNLLQPLPPISLPYTIRVDPAFHTDSASPPQPTIYDVRVPLPDPLKTLLKAFPNDPTFQSTLQEITTLDDHLALLVQALRHSVAKRGFFAAMEKDPVGFMRRWLGSQRRDLDVIMAEHVAGVGAGGVSGWMEDGVPGEEWRKGGEGGVWGSEQVRETVGLWLARGR
ncbi:MAG: SWI/SNF complex component snf12 [Caeruleum heppii]|nr:MAG: SWI/SNF complex component snf12 [Caeruleum heppii]